MASLACDGSGGQAPDRCDHSLFAVVEPVALVGPERSAAHLVGEFEQAAFADPGRAEQRQEVAVPEVGDADADAGHAQHVVAVPIVLLHLDAGEDESALVVDVGCVGDVRRRDRVAAVGQMRLREHGVAVDAVVVDDGDDDAPVGGVGVAVVGRVVEKGVARPEGRVGLFHVPGNQVGAAHDVDGQAFGHRQHLVVGGEDAAGEVACGVEDRGSRGAKQRVHHRAGDPLEAVAEQRESQRGTRSRRGGLFCVGHRGPDLAERGRRARVDEQGPVRAALDSCALVEHDGGDW